MTTAELLWGLMLPASGLALALFLYLTAPRGADSRQTPGE